MLGPTVEASLATCGIDLESELCSNDHLATKRSKGFAHEFLVREWAVDFCGVKEGDAALGCRPNHADHLSVVSRRPVAKAHAHAAKAESRHLQVVVPKSALLHCFLLNISGSLTLPASPPCQPPAAEPLA